MKDNKIKKVAVYAIMALATLLVASAVSFAKQDKTWHFNGTVIEACSCPMFCQCYFNTEPALHKTKNGAEHFCKFNMAYKINKGHYAGTDLAGVKFWVAGDLGRDWKKGHTEWAVVTFQPGTTEEQKAGVTTALSHIFPVKWNKFEVAQDAEIEWTATEDRAEAKLAKGGNAHIILNKWDGIGGETSLLKNVAYFGAPRNTGFKMMPNEIETWKVGDKAFEFKGSTGFMITVDMKSDDLGM
jgi:hypothetical protein